MADTKLRAILEAENQMGGTLGDAQGSLSKLGSAVHGVGTAMKVGLAVGATAAIGAVAGLGAVLMSSVKEAMAAEEVTAQLNAVIASTGGVAGVTADAINAHALALSGVTRFEDDAIVAADALLLTFTKVGKDVFPEATDAILDLSTSMGMDLNSAAMMVGKALNDPVAGLTAMGKAGVTFTQAQKDMIAAMVEAGDMAGAQKLILKELETQVGGSAVAAGQTFAGQLDILKNALGNVKESIGGALLPALTTLATTLGPVLITAAQGFATWAQTTLVPLLQTLFTWLATNIPIAIQTVSTFWTTVLQPAVAAVWSFLQTNVLPILQQLGQWLATNIPIAIQALATFWTGTLQPALAVVWSFIQTNVIPLLAVLADVWLKAVKTEAGLLAQFWTNVLQPALAVVWSFIQDNVIPILAVLLTWLTDNIPPAIQGLSDFWTNTLQPALAAVWSFIQDNVVPILATLLGWLADNLPPAIQGLADFWTNTLQPALAAVWAFIQDNVVPILETLLTWLADNLPPAIEGLRRMWENVLLPAIKTVWGFIDDHIIPLLRVLANVWIALVKTELTLMAGIWENVVKPALETVWNFINDHVIPIFETLANNLKGPIGDALNWFKDSILVPVAGAIDAIGGAIDGVIGWLQKMADKLASIHLPDWLTPGSPTPFEYGLRGINRALQDTTKQGLTDFTLGLDNLAPIIKQVVELFRQLAGYFADPSKGIGGAKAVTDALAPVFDNLAAIMDALQVVLDMGDLTGLSAKVAALVVILETDLPLLVAAFVAVAKLFSTEALAAAVVFADAAGKITAPMRDMVDAFTAVATWVPTDLSVAFAGMLSQLRSLAALWKTAANGFDEDMMEGALWFAGIASALVAPLQAMVQGFQAVATWVPAYLEPLFAGMLSQLRRLARLWKTAVSGFDEDMLEGALWFAGIASALVAPLQAMVQGFQAVATWVPQWLEPLFAGMLSQLRRLARLWKTAVSGFDEDMLEGALWFAGVASTLVAPLKAMTDGFAAVATWVPRNLEPLFAGMLSQLRRLAKLWIIAASGFDKDMLAAAVAFAETAGKLMAPIKAMVDGLNAVLSYASEQGGLRTHMQWFVSDLLLAAQTLSDALVYLDPKLLLAIAAAASASESIGKLLAFVKGAVDALTSLAGYSSEQGLGARVGWFADDLTTTTTALVNALLIFDAAMLKSIQAVEPVSTAIGGLLAFVQNAVDALTALAGYSSEQGLTVRAGWFAADVASAGKAILEALQGLGADVLDQYKAAADLSEHIGRLLAFVKSAIDALVSLAAYTAVENLRSKAEAFALDIVTASEEILAALTAAGVSSLDQYQAAADLSERIGRIVGVVSNGIAAIVALANYTAAGDIRGAVARFATDLLLVAEGLKEALRNAPPSLLAAYDAAIAFAERIGRIVGVIQPGLSAIQGLTNYTSAPRLQQSLAAFTTDILQVADYLKEALADPDDALLAAYDGAAQFGERISRLIGFVQPGLDALRALSSYGSREATALSAGMERFIRNVASLINYLATHLEALGPGAVTAAGGFAAQIATLVTDIRRGLTEVAAIGALQGAYDAAFATAQNWMSGIIDGITSRLGALEELMAYLRGLFPSSPAEHGPWQTLPDGEGLTAGWMGDMASGLGQTRDLERALGDVRGLMSLGSGLSSGLAGANGQGSAGGNVTLNLALSGPFYIREEADLSRLAEKVGDYLATQANKSRRMGQQRSSVGLA